ncbi:DUF885 family protein [Altererythrobacter arenosus]|uniref:DUF885 family protein n=1 Tax=Altererythrobacter arenosus TaxID=3032592 RepID=A0ABY8FR67_9SPHN|nr:DUF885 family protein [Altererythrobacter sp. CAU 1644]WFL77504.1 DUF885 family protein [Altererythrobacter sp. CAU 1644]
MDRRQFLASSGTTALAFSLNPALAFAQGTADERLRQVLEDIFAGDIELSPMLATTLGLDKGPNSGARSRLDRFTLGHGEQASQHSRQMLAELDAVPSGDLSEIWQVRQEIVRHMLDQRLLPDKFGINDLGSPYRISQQDGAYFSIPDFLDSTHPVETAEDAEAYLARLALFPAALDEQSEAQRADAARGYLAPGWALDLAMGQIESLFKPAAAETGLVGSLVRRAKEKGLDGEWERRASEIVENSVFPALRRQHEMLAELRPTTAAGDGVWRVPQGEEIYREALRHFTTTEMSAEEIHQTGLEQVAEISAELDTLLSGAGLTRGTVGERLLELNKRPEQLYPNTDEGRAELIASLNDGMAALTGTLPQAFNFIPDMPLDIRRVPPEIQDGASNGYYSLPTLDGSRPAIYWINLKDTADWPKYSLPALTYHEGNPGHHLHLVRMLQDDSLPLLLKNYWLSSYGEGWALYAEMVADELGGYSGLERAGALQSWLFRAARLVVDTGLNAKRWSVEQATQYFVDTVAFARARSQREIERYCCSPGQACSYKIGQNEWVRLRAKAESELGSRFSLGDFHEILQEGVMPLALLERRVDAWIGKVKAAS